MDHAVDDRAGQKLVSALTQCRIVYEQYDSPIADKFGSSKHQQDFNAMSSALKTTFQAQKYSVYAEASPNRYSGRIVRCQPHNLLVSLGIVSSTLFVITAGTSDDQWGAMRQDAFKKAGSQFRKWEKIVTLGASLSLVMEACLEPAGQTDQTQ